MPTYEIFGQSVEIEFEHLPAEPATEDDTQYVYQSDHIDVAEEIRQQLLYPTSLSGLLTSGTTQRLFQASRISLEQAIDSTDTEMAINHLGMTATLLSAASYRHFTLNGNGTNSDGSKILVAQAHLPLQRKLILDYELPSTEEAETAYAHTVEIGLDLVRLFERSIALKKISTQEREMVGSMSEIVTWILLARSAIKGLESEQHFVFFSQHSEDDANLGNPTKINRAWDISNFTKIGDAIYLTRRLQVKSSAHKKSRFPIKGEGIVLVNVQPDLRLEDDDKPPYITIIKEAAEELNYKTKARPRKRLNRRRDLLLEIIG